MKSGTIFDNIFVTDDIAEAEKEAKDVFEATKEGEKKMKDKVCYSYLCIYMFLYNHCLSQLDFKGYKFCSFQS